MLNVNIWTHISTLNNYVKKNHKFSDELNQRANSPCFQAFNRPHISNHNNLNNLNNNSQMIFFMLNR